MPTDRAKQLAFWFLLPTLFAVAVSVSFFAFFSSVVMGLTLVSMARSRKTGLARDVFFALLAAYVAANVLSLTQTQYWPESLRGVFKVLRQVFLCLSVAVILDTPQKVRTACLCGLAAAAVVSLDGWYQWVVGRDLFNARQMTAYFGQTGRWTGPFKHANDFSAYLAFAGIFYLSYLMDGFRHLSKRLFFLGTAGFALVASALLGTYSRTGWFVFMIGALVLAIARRNRPVLLGAALIVAWAVFFSPPLVKLRLQSIVDPHGGTVSERAELWGRAWTLVKTSPMLGLGVNTYSRNEHAFKWPSPKMDHQYAHNGYLQMAAEIGLLGLFVFLSAMFYFLFVSFKAFLTGPHRARLEGTAGLGLTAGAAALLVHSAFDTGLQSVLLVNLLWIAIGVAWAIRRLPA